MKNYIIIISLSLFIISSLHAQTEAAFETTFYFEDAIGNRDTIIVGFDPEANYMYNPDLGELDIDTPYDSIFEVRACHSGQQGWWEGPVALTKKIVGHVEPQFYPEQHFCLGLLEEIIFLVHAVHEPITISWDPTVFQRDYCMVAGVIDNHRLHQVSPFWYEEPGILDQTHCVAEKSSMTSNLRTDWIQGERIDSVGTGIDTLFTFYLNLRRQNSPDTGIHCNQFTVSTDEIAALEDINIYPNPTQGRLIIDTESTIDKLEIYSLSGEYLETYMTTEIDLSKYKAGVYQVKLQSKERVSVFNVVKI